MYSNAFWNTQARAVGKNQVYCTPDCQALGGYHTRILHKIPSHLGGGSNFSSGCRFKKNGVAWTVGFILTRLCIV